MLDLPFHHRTASLLRRTLTSATRHPESLSHLPKSVAEWYGLGQAVGLLHEFGQQDQPLEPDEFRVERDGPKRSVTPFLLENQDCCRWAFADGTDDPNVWIDTTAFADRGSRGIRPQWHDSRLTFSEFIYCRVWDFQRLPHHVLFHGDDVRNEGVCNLISRLPQLHSSFRGGAFTCDEVCRFGNEDARLLIGRSAGSGSAVYYVRGETSGHIENLCSMLAEVVRSKHRLMGGTREACEVAKNAWS